MRLRQFRVGLPPAALILATVVFVAADAGDQLVGGNSLFASGPLDETAHLLTMLLVLWAIGGAVFDRLLVPALVASVAIDLDHLPAELGSNFLTAGTPRPYTHSLLTIVIVLSVALLWPHRRVVVLAIAAALAVHFWRDMGEPGTGVALLWPFSKASDSLPHWSYLAVMTVVAAVGLRRSRRLMAGRASSSRANIRRPALRPSHPSIAGGQGAQG